jgi:hypothetical protein
MEVIKLNECKEWQGSFHHTGYGSITVNKKQWLAHRLLWTIYNGEIPSGMCILHRCDNRSCVNPDHLFLGTRGDNNTDRAEKGRSCRGILHPLSKLTDKLALEVYQSSLSSRKAAKYYNISPTLVKNIRNKRTWRHIHGD